MREVTLVMQSSEQLHRDLIEELQLIPDILSNSLAELRVILANFPPQFGKKEQELVAKLFEIVPRIVQPNLLLADGCRLVQQQALETVTTEASGAQSQNSPVLPTRNSVSNTSLARVTRGSSTRFTTINRASSGSVGLPNLAATDECLLEDIIGELQQLLPNLTGNHFAEFVPAVKNILDVYIGYLQLWKSAVLLERKVLLESKVQVEFKTDKNRFYFMSQQQAHKIICRDSYGYLRKANASGNHAVDISAKLVKKGSLEEGERDPILPGMEKIVVSFCNLLGEKLLGEDLTAPTTLIRLSQIGFQKVQPQLSDPVELEQFNLKLQQGNIEPEKLALQYPKVVFEPREIGACIQVGKTIHGWSLYDLLYLLQKFNQLQKLLGNDAFFRNFDFFITGKYLLTFLQTNQNYAKLLNPLVKTDYDYDLRFESNYKELFDGFMVLLSKIKPQKRLVEFKNIDFPNLTGAAYDNVFLEFKRTMLRFNPEQQLSALALLTYWPALMENEELPDIIQTCKIFKKVPEIFPGVPIQEIFVQLPQLQRLFDANNYTALIISSLLINPCDGKADNYMVEFVRNDQKRITVIKIKGIDNDQALADVFVRSKKFLNTTDPTTGKTDIQILDVHYAAIKCILYGMPQIHQPASPAVLQKLLNLSPEVFLLQWLAEQYQDDCNYRQLLKNTKLELDAPIRLDPNNIFSIYSKLIQLQRAVAGNLNITNFQMMGLIEPLLSQFYAKVVAQEQYPIPTISRIYHGKGGDVPTVEEVLSQELDNYFVDEDRKISWRNKLNTYTGSEHYAKKRTQTVEQVVEKFIQQIEIRRFFRNENLLWSILRSIAYFEFLTALPLDKNEMQRLLYIAIIKSEVAVVKLLIRCKDVDINLVYAEGYRTPLRLAVIQPNPSLPIIAALLQHKKINLTAFDRNGDTALSLANPSNDDLIATLIKYGVDIDARQVMTGKTLLDLAIEQQRPDVFIKLISKGAGRNIDVKKAFSFICQCKQQPAMQAIFEQAANTLATQNTEFATLLTIEAITQLDNPSQSLMPVDMLTNQGIERRYIKADAMDKIFDLENGQVKNIKRSNLYGRRNVAFVEHAGQKMHIKSHPEIFATEEGVKLLWRLIFPQGGVAESIVFSFPDSKTNKAYPVLISRHVEGNNLQKVVQDLTFSKSLIELDERRFSEVLVMTMLINPEDDKPDNKILRSFVNQEGITKLEIVGIDNDHAFVFPLLIEKGHRVLQVKTIVACLDQMKEPLHPAVRKIILNLSAKDLLECWLKSVALRQQCSDKLFSEYQRQEFFTDKDNPILTRMPLPKGIVAHMYGALLRMQEVLRSQPNISQIDFFCRVEPSFIAYKYILEDSDNPGARFHELFQRQYSTVVANRFDTLVTGKHILQSARIPDKDMISNVTTFGPEQALVELATTADEQNTLVQVKTQLLKGNIDLFKRLLLSSSREAILKEIVLKDLEPKLRAAVLSSLQNVSLAVLDLNGCADVRTDWLKPILEGSPNMLALNISGCEKIDSKILEIIAENCPALKKLYLNDLPWLTTLTKKDKPVCFPSLQKLWMNNAYNLKEFILKAPRLQWLTIKKAPNLVRLNIQGQSLSHLSLQDSAQIFETDFLRLLGQSPDLLKSLQIKAEIKISARSLAWLNSGFDSQQWQSKNVEALLIAKQLLLQGLSITDTDLQNIIYYARHIEHINLVGTSLIGWQGFAMLLNKSLSLQSLKKTNYALAPAMKSYNAGVIEAFGVGFEDQLLSVSRDKFFKVLHVAAPDTAIETIPNDKPFSAICAVNGLAFTGSVDGTIKVWDIEAKTCIQTTKAHATTVKALQYLPARNLLISGSDDRTIKFLDIYTGAVVKSISNRFKVNTLELIDRQLIVGGDNGSVSIYKTTNYEQLNTFNAHQNSIFALRKISSNLVATGSGDYTAKVWDINSGRCVSTLLGHTGPVSAIEVLQGGQLIATGSLDKTIKIWDVITSECLMTLSDHSRKITALALVENKLVSASEDGTLKTWEFPISEIIFDIPRNSKPFKLLAQDCLIRLQVQPKLNVPLLKYAVDFVSQTVGISGVGVNMDVTNGEAFFAINNKDKYIMVEQILLQLNKFISTAAMVDLATWQKTRRPSALAVLSAEVGKESSPQFWQSAKPMPETNPQPKTKLLALQSRLFSDNASVEKNPEDESKIAEFGTGLGMTFK